MIRFLFCLLLSFPAAAQEESAVQFLKTVEQNREKTGFVYNMSVESVDGTLTYRTFSQDGKWRMDGETNNQKTRVLFDGKKTVIILGNTAIEQDIEKFGAMPSEEEMVHYTLGQETTFDKYPCRMITNASAETEMCIHEEFAMPVYAKTPDFTMTVTDIEKKNLESSTFEVPQGIQVLDLKNFN